MVDSATFKMEKFFSEFRKLSYKKGETILRAGEEPRGVFFLKKGFVKLYSLSKDGEELTLIIFMPGDLFPITWALNEASNTYYLEAMTPCELMRSPVGRFLDFVSNNSDVYFDLTGRMLTRLGGVLRRMEHLVFGNAYSKVASILLLCADRFGKKQGKNIIIEVPLTHSDIAKLIGVSRETISLELKKLENKKLVSRKGKLVVIKNYKSLMRESVVDTFGE